MVQADVSITAETDAEAKLSHGATAMAAKIAPPKKSWRQLASEVLAHGGPGYVQFAITNICNAACGFCGFAVDKMAPASRRSVTLEEAVAAIEVMAREHIGYLLFVGGEPLVHPHLAGMLRHAARRGIRPMICTNGSLWTETNMRVFADAGLADVIMSIDAHDAAAHEANRRLPEVCRKIQRANAVFGELGVPTTASVTASRLIRDYSKLPGFLRELGFSRCTFSYPVNHLASGYLGFSTSTLVNFKKEELLAVFDAIKQLKSQTDFPVMNPFESLADMQRHLRGEKERFGCLGGHKYFYLDWNLHLYRCHAWDKPLCHIRDFDASKLIRDGCTRCMIDCYRDASVLQFPATNASDAWHHLKSGRFAAVAKTLADPRNLAAVRALWESRQWIRDV